MSSTPATGDYSEARSRALDAALELYDGGAFQLLVERHGAGAATDEVRSTASDLFHWLIGPAIMFLTVGPVVSQDTGLPVINPLGGNPMQLRDNEQVDLSVTVASARGNVIGDQPGTEDDLTWSVSGDEGVVTLEVSADTRTATVKAAGPVGSTVVRVEVGELFATQAIDVVPGEAALITVTVGAPTEQQDESPEQPGEESPEQPGEESPEQPGA